MAIVVYNPAPTPVNTATMQIDGESWKYVEDQMEVQSYINAGRLIIAHAPADISQINPAAYEAFDALRKGRKSRRKPAAAIPPIRDTELSEVHSTTETEA